MVLIVFTLYPDVSERENVFILFDINESRNGVDEYILTRKQG